jgi:hypothetical protein
LNTLLCYNFQKDRTHDDRVESLHSQTVQGLTRLS